MRLTCDVDIGNRLLPTFNMQSKQGKSTKVQLSVGHKPGSSSKDSEVYIMICSKQNLSGNFYKLKGNVQQAFIKFVHEGKATLRFSEPQHDLCISKADPVQLKGFLSVVRMACQGKGLDKVTLSSLAPASSKIVEKLKTKMTIMKKQDYPVTTNFSNTLEHLSVQNCTMKRFDSRMLKLRHLKVLNLSHNNIRILPDDFSGVPHLVDLNLSHNMLTDLPKHFCTSPELQSSLSLLDISHNCLKILHPYFCKLRKLVTLNVDHNEIVCLPQSLGHLSQLRQFTANNNKLRTMPASFGQLRLDMVSLCDNVFMEAGTGSAINKLKDMTLLELAARAIKHQKISYTDEDVGPLTALLDRGQQCLCGRYSFTSHVHYLSKLDLHQIASSLCAVDSTGRTYIPCEAFLCSQTCFSRYQKNPLATMWK